MSTSKSDNTLIAWWLFASLVAVLPALHFLTAALVDGEFIPVGNDALYHARRILDAAIGERGFYQFDAMIHAPEGSWVTWPWAYDYFMAQALKLALWISPTVEPMKFLAYVPVCWLLVNMGLLALLARSLQLPTMLIAVLLLGFAVSPLTQSLHGVGSIDHHFLELTLVLLSTWSGVRFFSNPSSRSAAIQLGVALGIAPAAHNSLFIVQIPVLIAALVMWLRGRQEAFEHAHVVALALLASALAVVLPSEPFQQFFFEFTTLSWFHLYVALCSAASLFLMQRLPNSGRNRILLGGALILLALPLLAPFISGANYVAGGQVGLQGITEVASPFRMMLDAGAPLGATRYYGYLIFLAPALVAAFAWLMFTSKRGGDLFFAIAGIFGVLMLLTQFRFHPFGYWALLLGALYFANRLAEARAIRTSVVGIGCALALLIAMQPVLQFQLFKPFVPGLAREYAVIYPMFAGLAEACAEQPGIALGSANDGHPIRYHTDCSVISNNFLLTKQHGEKLILAETLLRLDPAELPTVAPGVRYVLVHIYGIYTTSASGPVATPLDELKASNPPLFYSLAIDQNVPTNYQLLAELRVEDDRGIPYAQIYRINPL